MAATTDRAAESPGSRYHLSETGEPFGGKWATGSKCAGRWRGNGGSDSEKERARLTATMTRFAAFVARDDPEANLIEAFMVTTGANGGPQSGGTTSRWLT